MSGTFLRTIAGIAAERRREFLPEWSERPGRPAYLFIDEIKVE